MVCSSASEPLCEFSFECGTGEHEYDGGDGECPQEHEEELLQEYSCSAFLVTCEYEFHCTPFDAPMPEHVDEVDQDDCSENRQKPEQGGIDEHAFNLAVFGEIARRR